MYLSEHMLTIDNINYLTVKESAIFLKVAQLTIRRWIKSGKIKPINMSIRKTLINEEHLKNFLK